LRFRLQPKHMQALLGLSRGLDRITDWIARCTSYLIILTIGVGFYNVLVRYIGRYTNLQLSSNALIELQWYLFSMSFFLGFAYILKHGANVRVDFLYSQWTEQRKALVDFLGTVFFLIPFCILGIFVTIDPVLTSWGLLPDGSISTWEISPDANGLPRAPIKSMIIISFATLLLQAIAQAIKYMAIFNGYHQVAEAIQEDTEQFPLE
jgi:TRAP-type mannitol/chloroaromatic compound transport system permease small subunit